MDKVKSKSCSHCGFNNPVGTTFKIIDHYYVCTGCGKDYKTGAQIVPNKKELTHRDVIICFDKGDCLI